MNRSRSPPAFVKRPFIDALDGTAATSEAPARCATSRIGCCHATPYSQIIEAIDVVTEDGLKRKAAVDLGVAEVIHAEREMLPILKKFQESQPKDISRYEFSLKLAIETTSDSLDLAQEDLADRFEAVQAKAEKEKKEIESVMQPKDLEEKKAEEKKAAATEEKKRKPPSLLRPGEQVGRQ